MFLETSRGRVERTHFGTYKWWTARPSLQRYVRVNMYVRFVGPNYYVEGRGIFAFRQTPDVTDSVYRETRHLYPDRVVEDHDLRPNRPTLPMIKVCTLLPYEVCVTDT